MVEIIVGVLGGLSLILVAQLERVRQHAKATREQVQNSHTVNLRDDLDRRFARVEHRFDGLDARMDRVERRHRTCRRWWHRH